MFSYIIYLVIVWRSYSQSEIVRIPVTTANNIYRDLIDYDLVKSQLLIYESMDSLNQMQISTYKEINNKLLIELNKQNKWYRKPKVWGISGLFMGILTGVYISR